MFSLLKSALRFSLLLLLLSGPAGMAGVVLAPESPSFPAGGELRLTLWLNNPGPGEATITLPRPLRVRLSAGDRAADVALESDPPAAETVRLAPRSFQRLQLSGRVPADLEGPVTADLPGSGAEPVMFDVTPAAPEVAAAARSRDHAELREEFARHSPEWLSFFNRFSPYDPMYFVVGFDEETSARFQISFKYRLILPNVPIAERNPWLGDFYLGYTQRSLWLLGEDSSPFLDTTYAPAFFYERIGYEWTPSWASRIGLRAGYEHNSNGQDGDDSRSLDRVFIRPLVTFGSLTNWHVNVAPKAWFYLGETEGEDLPDYEGYFELYAELIRPFDVKLAATWRVGTALDRGFVQLDLSYPLNRLWTPRNADIANTFDRGFGTFLHAQYFIGHGETMLYYDDWHSGEVRIGLSFVR
ncbi:MAG: phospholipase A [Limisphaerales bacterium]